MEAERGKRAHWKDGVGTAWTTGKAIKWVLEQIKPETSLEGKRAPLKLSYFGHTTRGQGSLEKTVMLGKTEDSRKRGRPNARWISSPKEARGLCLQELSRAADRTLWTPPSRQESEPTQWHGTHLLAQTRSHASCERGPCVAHSPFLSEPDPGLHRPRERRPQTKGRDDET